MHSDDQRKAVKALLAKAQDQYSRPIVTAVSPLEKFYEAEDYHQQYFEKNPEAGYCRMVISPKLKKVDRILKK